LVTADSGESGHLVAMVAMEDLVEDLVGAMRDGTQ
jgi:Mg2+/Co2+ transporter CorB